MFLGKTFAEKHERDGEVRKLRAEIERLTLFERAHPQLQKTLRDAYDKIEGLEADNAKLRHAAELAIEFIDPDIGPSPMESREAVRILRNAIANEQIIKKAPEGA